MPQLAYSPASPYIALRVPRSYARRTGLMQFAVPPGVGDYQQEVATGAQIASSGAAATVAILVAIGSVGGPVGAAIGAAAGALIAIGAQIAKAFEGCGQTCVIASNDANKYGDLLTQNVQAYVSAPFNPQLQAAALNNFDTLWAALAQACGDPSLGQAGVNCIGDRQRGACKWKSSPGGWVADPTASGGYRYTAPGPAGSGDTCWNYFVGMRDPIANDPRAANYNPSNPTGGATGSTGSTSSSSSGGSTDYTIPLLLAAVAIVLVVAS
jgi:hypothetical protein